MVGNCIPYNPDKFPDWIGDWRPSSVNKPDVWIEPNASFLMEIMASEIVQKRIFEHVFDAIMFFHAIFNRFHFWIEVASHTFPVGYGLRFPRAVHGFRDDKDWHEAMTESEFKQLVADNLLTLRKRKVAEGADSEPEDRNTPEKRPRKFARKNGAVSVAQLTTDLVAKTSGITADIQKKSEIFEGKRFYVANGIQPPDSGKTRAELETWVAELGGQLVLERI